MDDQSLKERPPVIDRSKAARRGYTLSEMLVVLGVLVVVAALAQPALRSALGDSRLRSAARQVRGALAKARLEAMRTGVAQRFRYQVGTNTYEVAPAVLPLDGAEAGTEETLTAAMESASSGEESPTPPLRAVEEALPEGVSFEQIGERLAATAEGWSEPIVFHPNGRTSNAEIRLRGERNAVVEVSLRGLTGAATAGRPRHEEEVLR